MFASENVKETKQQRLQAVRAGTLRYEKIETIDLGGKQYGDLCIVTGTFDIIGHRNGVWSENSICLKTQGFPTQGLILRMNENANLRGWRRLSIPFGCC